VHQFKPTFREAALLDDPEMLAAVTALNRQITELGPVLNSPTIRDAASVQIENPEAPVAVLTKRHGGATYLFAVGMRGIEAAATFAIGVGGDRTIEVLGEDRKIQVTSGSFKDHFSPWDVHVYRWAVRPER